MPYSHIYQIRAGKQQYSIVYIALLKSSWDVQCSLSPYKSAACGHTYIQLYMILIHCASLYDH